MTATSCEDQGLYITQLVNSLFNSKVNGNNYKKEVSDVFSQLTGEDPLATIDQILTQ